MRSRSVRGSWNLSTVRLRFKAADLIRDGVSWIWSLFVQGVTVVGVSEWRLLVQDKQPRWCFHLLNLLLFLFFFILFHFGKQISLDTEVFSSRSKLIGAVRAPEGQHLLSCCWHKTDEVQGDKEAFRNSFCTKSQKAGCWHQARVDSHLVEAVAFSNSMNRSSLSTGEREGTGVGLKLSLQLGQIRKRNSNSSFFSYFLADCL